LLGTDASDASKPSCQYEGAGLSSFGVGHIILVLEWVIHLGHSSDHHARYLVMACGNDALLSSNVSGRCVLAQLMLKLSASRKVMASWKNSFATPADLANHWPNGLS
jgi:hypothetical protein